MNRGVKLNKYHSVKDFDMVMSSKIIPPAEPKKYIIEVEGGDGSIDLSTVLTGGDIKYKNRMIEINLVKIIDSGDVASFRSMIQDLYHGQIVRLTFDEDPLVHYSGRATLSYNEINSRILEIKMLIDCYPYKLKNDITIATHIIQGSKVVSYQNMRKWVSPEFFSSGDLTVEFEGVSYSLTAGSFIIPDIVFKPGENIIVYTGDATVTVSYQEGGL